MSTRGEFGRKGLAGECPAGRDPYAEQRAAFIAQHRTAGPERVADALRDPYGAAPLGLAHPIETPTTYHGSGNYDYPSGYAADTGARTLSTAYALWLLLGMVSGHRIYFGALLSATIQTVLLWLGVAMILQDSGHVGAGRALVLIYSVWWLIDLFQIPELVRNHAVEEGVAFG